MNRLLVALIAGAFALISASAFADDSSVMPLSKMDTEQAKAARAAAQEKWAKMTPEQQAAAKKAAREKKLADASAIDMLANESMAYDTKQGAADTAASKAAPKSTKEERKKALEEQSKKASGQ